MLSKLRVYKKLKEELIKSKNQTHYLNMTEKKDLVLKGEHVPIYVNSKKAKSINTGPVKYYSKYLDKKMKL